MAKKTIFFKKRAHADAEFEKISSNASKFCGSLEVGGSLNDCFHHPITPLMSPERTKRVWCSFSESELGCPLESGLFSNCKYLSSVSRIPCISHFSAKHWSNTGQTIAAEPAPRDSPPNTPQTHLPRGGTVGCKASDCNHV